MNVDMDAIKAFFFEAMLQGWVNPKSHAEPVEGMPGYKGYEYRKGGLYLRDVFIVNPETGKSAGNTTILLDDNPVWVMHYGGMYPKAVINIVKIALTRAYKQEQFCGGRGVICLNVAIPFGYFNHINKGTFEDFCGRESVYHEENKQVVGYHDYWGMSLV
jgi:hypothetical protein